MRKLPFSIRLISFLIIASFFYLYSCKKDVGIQQQDPVNSSSTNIGDTITIGDTTNMFVTLFNDTFFPACMGCANSFPFDVDNNGMNDLSFHVWAGSSPGCGSTYYSSLCCLNANSLFNGYFTNDTFFLHQTISVSYDTVPPILVYVNINNTYTFHSISNTDSILNFYPNTLKFLPLISGDNLIANQTYKTDSLTLNYQPCSSWPQTHVSNDTMYYTQQYYLADQYVFPINQQYYLGFKLITNSSKSKLGWIRIKALGKSSAVLYESAIQK